MAFCRYCGQQIPEGGSCNCEQAVAAQKEASAQSSQPANTESTPTQAAPQQAAPQQAAAAQAAPQQAAATQAAPQQAAPQAAATQTAPQMDFAPIIAGVKDFALRSLKQPISTLSYAWQNPNVLSQYSIGIVYLLLLLICPFIEAGFLSTAIPSAYRKEIMKEIPLLSIAFSCVITVALSKAAVCLVAFLTAKVDFKKLIGVVCVSSVTLIILRLVIGLVLVTKLFEVLSLLILFNYIYSVLLDYELFAIAFGEGKKDKKFWIFVATELVIVIVAFVVGRSAVIDKVSALGGGMF